MTKGEFTDYHNREDQVYEDYWNYTAAFTDFNSEKFLETLRVCLNFIQTEVIDKSKKNKVPVVYSIELYQKLQEALQQNPQTKLNGSGWDASQRKRINQLVKLGFIEPFLRGFPDEAKLYISDKVKTNKKRQSILSKIVYKYANLCNSTTNDVESKQLKFFIRSLEEIGSFSDVNLATIMTIDIKSFGKDFADSDDLNEQYKNVDIQGFISRKYNQISHLKNVLSKLEDLVVHDKAIYFKTDALRLFGEEIELKKEVRDPYLQRVYKSELENETVELLEKKRPVCMLDGFAHPVLIASHIKPYRDCDENEAFDVNNGLLLNKSLDSLFDLGYITFNENWDIVTSEVLEDDLAEMIKQYKLPEVFKNDERFHYMEYHRQYVFNKRYAS